VGDCWIGLSLADSSGLILAARVGKHTDGLYAFGGAKPYEELVVTTEGKTACNRWNSDGWGGYERCCLLRYCTPSAKPKRNA
jgi:hypothetical protein